MKRTALISRLGMGVLLAAAPSIARAGNDGTREFHSYGVEVFQKIGNACKGGDLGKTNEQAHNFFEVFRDWENHGDWGFAEYYYDDEVEGRYFTDSLRSPQCEDYQTSCSLTARDDWDEVGADAADVVFLSTHGSYRPAVETVSWTMGDDGYDCSVSSAENMYWNGDAEILIIDACNSGRYTIWRDSFSTVPAGGLANMLSPTGTMNTLLGYHGNAPDRKWGKHYAEDAYENGIGLDWVVEGYEEGNMKDDQDTCPVAMIFGEDESDREHMYEWGGFNDREDTGDPKGSSTYFYIVDCDPVSIGPVE
jgi:hypothetical protein